jgi:isoleucyl-tRNA synthetase
VISLLNTLKKEVKEHLEAYDPTPAARKIAAFVDSHLSNWYVRLCRRRFWKGEYTADKVAAYQTLYECLLSVAKLMAPIAPFFAEWLFKNLNDATELEKLESVHLGLFPESEIGIIDKDLEERMDYAQRISSLVLSLRKQEKLRVRQPLKRILLPVLDDEFKHQIDRVKDLILSEVNVKQIEYITDTSGLIKKKIKPNFKTLGRMLGKNMKDAAKIIMGLNQEDIASIEENNFYQLYINGETFDLTTADFEILSEDIPGWQVANDGPLTVALDISLDDNLKAEGMARELVNRIQGIRKNKDFEVTDKIDVHIGKHDLVIPAVRNFADYIKGEVLAVNLSIVDEVVGGEMVQLEEGVDIAISVSKS